MSYLIFTSTAGQHSAETLAEARAIAAGLETEEWDQPRIIMDLVGCAGTGCTCAGQIHPQWRVVTDDEDGSWETLLAEENT